MKRFEGEGEYVSSELRVALPSMINGRGKAAMKWRAKRGGKMNDWIN